VHGIHEVSLAAARHALGGTLLLPVGASGLRFEGARIVNLVTGYDHKRPFRHSIAVQIRYRSNSGQLTLNESRFPDMIAGFTGANPAPGTALVRYSAGLTQLSRLERERLADATLAFAPWRAISRAGRLYVSVNSWSKPQLLQVAGSLQMTRR
jgi:hypothetical protein